MNKLRPHIDVIYKFLNGSEVDIWTPVRSTWREAVEGVRSELKAMRSGNRHHINALRAIIKINDSAPEDEIILLLMGLGHLWHYDPRTFRSDRAFTFMVAMRLWSLVASNTKAYRYADASTKRALKFPQQGTLEALGRLLIDRSVVLYGVQIGVEIDRRRAVRNQVKAEALKAIRSEPQQTTVATTVDLMIPEGEA